MTFMFEINEAANPILTILPILLMTFSGYVIGLITSHLRGTDSVFFKDLLYGNLILNFIFVSGFVFFGALLYLSNAYFTIFNFILIGLTVIGISLLVKRLLTVNEVNFRKYFLKSSFYDMLHDSQSIFILLGISLFAILIVYQGIIIYYHSIFGGEFDSIYLFLPISKSILLGDGLNHDFYLGSDINVRYAPFTQALNAWLIHSYTYSSLKLFPIYFIFFTSVFIYYLAKSITRDKILALISSIAFLITPSLLFTTSKYSLQEDLAFMFFLVAAFYFIIENIRNFKMEKNSLILLSISLAILPLSREIGLVISCSLFFLLPAVRYTRDTPKLRAIFTFLAFIPLYALSFYDVLSHGFTNTVVIRLLVVIIANVVVFYIASLIKNQYHFSLLIKGNLKYYLFPLMVPFLFITINVIAIHGPYITFTIDPEFNAFTSLQRQLMEKPSEIFFDLEQSLSHIPQIQLMFVSVQMGFVFLIFKIRGFVILIDEIKKNPQYALLLILTTIVLVTWSYLLGSDIEDQSNRHLLYIIPLFSVILVVGMKVKTENILHYLYCYGIIIFSTFFFLNYSLSMWIYQEGTIFSGFIIEKSIGGFVELAIAIALVIPLILFRYLSKVTRFQKIKKSKVQNYVIIVCIVFVCAQLLILQGSAIPLTPIEVIDLNAPTNWEGNVVEVANYLNKNSDNKNVFGIYVPAIPFFTNRTAFDIYYPGSFTSVYPLLRINDSSDLEQELNEMDIGYIVIPNQKNTALYKYVQNIQKDSEFIQTIQTNPNFIRIQLPHFDVYKYDTNYK